MQPTTENKILEELAEHRVRLQYLQVTAATMSAKLDDLVGWQREVKASMKITAAIASFVGGAAGFLLSLFFGH